MRRKMIGWVILVLCGLLVGCSSIPTQPTVTFDKLTPDEQSRVVVGAIQDGSSILFDVGKGVMLVKPEYSPAWKLGVVPSFNELNAVLLDIETRGSHGEQITFPAVLNSVQGRISTIISTIAQYGTIPKPNGSTKPTANDYGLIAVLGLSTASVVWNDIVGAMNGQVISWEMIKARNLALQGKINSEK